MKFQKFNDFNIVTTFIKQLIASKNIPMVPVIKVGDKAYKNCVYIYDNLILRARDTFIIDTQTSGNDVSKFELIGTYIEGNEYPGVTSKFVSESSYYDSNTHYYLGQYLRYLRDVYNIDLMCYYNCFNAVYNDFYRIVKNNNKYILSNRNIKKIADNYKLLLIPIKVDKKYLIYGNCALPIIGGYDYFTNDLEIADDKGSSQFSNAFSITNLTMRKPYEIDTSILTSGSINPAYEYLTLVLQVPKNMSSNILVLEIDKKFRKEVCLSDNKLSKVIMNWDRTNRDILTDNDIKEICNPLPSLTRAIGNNTYAFSYRLVEYLLSNVIYKYDDIYGNIKRIQEYISSSDFQKVNNTKFNDSEIQQGIWSDKLQAFIYNVTTNKYLYDQDGNVNKDAEKIITSGHIFDKETL